MPFNDSGTLDPLPITTQAKSFFTNTTFGTIDQLRVELETSYQGIQITLESEDKKNIDCMFLPGVVDNSDDVGREDVVLPTMIYCSPNAFLYEAFQFENEWLEFYKNLGINFFVWNYRGYGRSEGTPHPTTMYSDAEMIVDYLRNERKITKRKYIKIIHSYWRSWAVTWWCSRMPFSQKQ